jgi:hypothetical protein
MQVRNAELGMRKGTLKIRWGAEELGATALPCPKADSLLAPDSSRSTDYR